jgi:hypothetical protein
MHAFLYYRISHRTVGVHHERKGMRLDDVGGSSHKKGADALRSCTPTNAFGKYCNKL